MLNVRFNMFKMRDLSDFRHKITEFILFKGKNQHFSAKKLVNSQKLSNFAHE